MWSPVKEIGYCPVQDPLRIYRIVQGQEVFSRTLRDPIESYTGCQMKPYRIATNGSILSGSRKGHTLLQSPWMRRSCDHE